MALLIVLLIPENNFPYLTDKRRSVLELEFRVEVEAETPTRTLLNLTNVYYEKNLKIEHVISGCGAVLRDFESLAVYDRVDLMIVLYCTQFL